MKEVKLTEKDLYLIKCEAVEEWVKLHSHEYANVEAIINSFVKFCNTKKYTVQNGRILLNNEEEK